MNSNNSINSIKAIYEVHLTQTGWHGIENLAKKFNLSVSDLLEKVGSGLLSIVDPEELEDELDLQEALAVEADPENKERITWEQVKQELGL